MTTNSSALVAVDRTPSPSGGVELGTLRAGSPSELVTSAAAIAKSLTDVIERQRLYTVLSGRKFVRVEGWTTCAALLGCTPHEISVEQHDGVYTAMVELRRLVDGQPVSRASAECGAEDEVDRQGRPMWANRPAYARRSMAITRATGKACRLAFSWILTLGGYEPTPAEELTGSMGHDEDEPVHAPEPPAARDVTPPAARPVRPTPPAREAGLISDAQQKRFFAIAKQHGWSDEAIRALLQTEGMTRSNQITRVQYEALCAALEAGPTPAAQADPVNDPF